MNWPSFEFDVGLDLFPMAAGLLAALVCALLGNFLVLRRLSLMGDAISHSVLPGLVIAVVVTSSRAPFAMFLGAAIAGVATVVLVEAVKRLGGIEPGAAMGVVFSVLFALGVLLIEEASIRQIDLDADCLLHGQLETLVWFGAPETLGEAFSPSTLQHVPRQVVVLFGTLFAAVLFVAVLFKELRIAAFDPSLATSQGFHAGVLHYVLMVFVAAATVASFEAVGSILVIAMLICPAATARLLTDRMRSQVVCSMCIAATASLVGYVAASAVPSVWDKEPVNAAGSMTVVGGVLLVAAIIASPRHGLLVRVLRRRRLARQIAVDDVVAALFRLHERGESSVTIPMLARVAPGRETLEAVGSATALELVALNDGTLTLTSKGLDAGAGIIRRHRLWETWLVDEAGVSPDHVHDTAERLEHLPPEPRSEARIDPHGKNIPSR
ncbi:MAG: iron chelate uptake ABC transporter family permease subunit [Planctomycetota bacterium]